MHIHHTFNYPAIVVCAVFLWILGAAWYSPAMFARPWVAIVGRKMGEKPQGVVLGMVSSFVGDLLLAFVMDHFIIWANVTTLAWGVMMGFICWVGFVAGPLFPQHIYEGRPRTYFLINAGYWLIGMMGTGAILGVWR